MSATIPVKVMKVKFDPGDIHYDRSIYIVIVEDLSYSVSFH